MVFSAIKKLGWWGGWRGSPHVCIFHCPTLFLPKTHLAGKSQISPHFLNSFTRNLLVFFKHERGPTHGRRKSRKEKRGNRVVSSVHDSCMILSHFNELFLSWVCTSFCNLQHFHDIIIIIIIKFVVQFVAFGKSHGLFLPFGQFARFMRLVFWFFLFLWILHCLLL